MVQTQLSHYDIIVAGGGISGVVSAIAAARQGLNVVLVEKASCLGGCATSGMLGEMNGTSLHGRNMLPEIGRELVSRLMELGAALPELEVPMTSNPKVLVDRVRYNAEYMKIVMDDMTGDAGVQVLLSCQIHSARKTAEGIELTIANAYETLTLSGSFLIDCTGNSECIYHLGGETVTTKPDNLQAVTTMFRLGGVNMEQFLALSTPELQEIIRRGQDAGVLPAHILAMLRIPGTRDIAVNCTRSLRVNHESLLQVSASYRVLRHQIKEIVPFLVKNVPGCENAYLSGIAPALGVRDRRKAVCLYELTGDDVVTCRDFPDAVAVGVYPVDRHINTGNSSAVSFKAIEGNGIYKLPYRSMVPKNLEHVLACGKGVDTDDEAFGAFRTMGPLMSIATAAGTAAAMVVKDGCKAADVNIPALQEALRKAGTVEI